MIHYIIPFLLSLLTLTTATATPAPDYSEHLTLQPLPRNSLLTTFTFESYSTPTNNSYGDSLEYSIFPRSLGQILKQSNTQELHLRFSQGWWDVENWGSPPNQGMYSGGLGVELWAWVEGNNLIDAKNNWRKLVQILSGLFCASLNFIDDATTTFPVKSFQPFGLINNDNTYLLHGALPREPVCTENLTPFLKLVPCKGKAGISSLLDGHKIFDAQWQSMSIDVSIECDEDGLNCRKKMTQTINAIIDISRSINKKISPVPVPTPFNELRCNTTKPYNSQFHCFPLKEDENVDWLLSDIFGRQISGSCPLSTNENIQINVNNNWDIRFITNKDDSTNITTTTNNSYKLDENIFTDIQFTTTNNSNIIEPENQPILVERSFTGYGLQSGGLRSTFTNPTNEPIRFVYFETFPWFMRVYLHTLKLDNDDPNLNILQDIHYTPAIDRKRPTQLEIEILLPPQTTTTLTYQFDKALLFIEEYPPDANHGFDIAPGILTTIDENDHLQYTIRTTSLLLQLPTPDFSMPYNVIILTGTVMALVFGNIFNLLTKRIVTDEQAEEISQQMPIQKFIKKIKSSLEKKAAPNHE